MKLKQTLVINDKLSTLINDGDILAHLFNAQFEVARQLPQLGPTWLQDREDFLQRLYELRLCGKVHIFDLAERVSVTIQWTWVEPMIPSLTGPFELVDFARESHELGYKWEAIKRDAELKLNRELRASEIFAIRDICEALDSDG